MNFRYDEQRRLFQLDTADMTYAFCVTPGGRLNHLHWGGKVGAASDFDEDIAAAKDRINLLGNSDRYNCRQEYAAQEPFDYGQDAIFPVFADGVRGARLVYRRHEFSGGCLKVFMKDAHYPLEVELQYRTIGDLNLLSRSAVIRNLGEEPIVLERALSATAYLPEKNYRMTHFSGNWGAEFTRRQLNVDQQQIVLENHRGNCAAQQHVPFVALDTGGEATETAGEVFFGALKWSGDIRIVVERDFFGEVRVSAGMNDYDFRWNLTKDHPLTVPEFVLGYTQKGFGGMSKALYDWQFDHLCPQNKAHQQRPVIYNSWYPYEFSVDEENCIAMAKKAASIGAELFVIDDGWMPGRINSHAGLGDWTPDKARFPNGLGPIADACHEAGIKFGLWVEPEMVNPDSDLYRAHPEWVLGDTTRPASEMRNQFNLNLALDEVRDWCIKWLDRLITDCKLDYLKWDMNRYIAERGPDRQMPVKYIQNLYAIWQSMNERHPNVLYENCASGAARADFGMAPYTDRINRSDNADTVDVMRLHEGFSTLFLPKLAGGAGNISPSPNGVNDRVMPLDFRAASGMTGSMSIGIDLIKCTQEDILQIRDQVSAFKRIRETVQSSYVLRLKSVYDGNISALEYLRRDGKEAILFVFGHGLRYMEGELTLRLRGLQADAMYETRDGRAFSGTALMNKGVKVSLTGDYASKVIRYTKR